MYINIEKYELSISDEEMLSLIWALIYMLERQVEHCASYEGMKTLRSNHRLEIEILAQLCISSARKKLLEDQLNRIEQEINEAIERRDQ